MDLGLVGKNAFVSGGSHGIGRAIASSLIEEGCNAVICGGTRERLYDTCNELWRNSYKEGKPVYEDRGGFSTYQCNVLDSAQVLRTSREVIDRFGKVDILVNCVGGGGRWGSEIYEETNEIVWREVMEKNLIAAVEFTNAFLPAMIERKFGRVVTISSIDGKESGGRPWFVAAKAAEIAYMKSMSKEPRYASANITFNTVCPGAIYIPDTGWDANPEEYKKKLEGIPRGKMGDPQDVANVVTFLCSNKAAHINGATITVDGGESHSL